jgi:HK97 family phage major capsid protein
MEENRTLLRKAELAISDLSSGGLLQPAQADKFIKLAIKEPVLLRDIYVTPMKAFREERDKMRFSSRVLKRGAEATGLPSTSWAKPALSLITLDAQLFKAETRISDEALEDQIERGVFKETLINEMSRAIGRDMEWIAINGDTLSADPTLSTLDGILKQVTTNVVNNNSAKFTKATARDMYRLMPDEFAMIQNLKYYTNRQARIDFKDSYADRGTILGDAMLTSKAPAEYNEMEIKAVPEFPVNQSNNTQALLCDPQGIYLGIYRAIKLKLGEDISAGVVIINVSVRFDVKVVEQLAVVKATNVKGA